MAEKDLQPGGFEKDRKAASEAGKKSVESRRKKKKVANLMRILLDMPANEEAAKEIAELYGLEAKDITNEMAILLSQINKASVGQDTTAANFFYDRIEGKPIQQQKVEQTNLNYEVDPEKDKATLDMLKQAWKEEGE